MKAAIIRITDLSIDCDKPNILEQIQDLVDDIDIFELTEFKDQESLNLLVVQTLMNSIPREALERTVNDSENKTDNSDLEQHQRLRYNVGATVASILETHEYLYAAYFVSLEDLLGKEEITEEEYRASKMNRFGSQVCNANVASDMIIVRQDLEYEVQNHNVATSMRLGTLSEYIMIRDLVSIFSHRALIVESNGDSSEYFYIQNPLENVIMTDSNYEDNYRYHEYEVYNHQMMVFVDVRCTPNDSILNERVSQITGSKVYGRALVSLSRRPEFNENPAFADLTDKRFDAICSIKSRGIDTPLSMGSSDKVYMNFDKILELTEKRSNNLPVRSVDSLVGVLNTDK